MIHLQRKYHDTASSSTEQCTKFELGGKFRGDGGGSFERIGIGLPRIGILGQRIKCVGLSPNGAFAELG